MSRRRKLVPLILVSSLALLAPAHAAVSHQAHSTPAPATVTAKAGKWVQLSSTAGITNIDEPDVLRLATGGVQVVWRQQDNAFNQSIRTRVVKESGRIGTPISAIAQSWSGIVNDPQIIRHGGERLVAFGGIRSTDPSETLTGEMAYATSTNGTSWSIGPGSLSASTNAYASNGTSAVDDGGTPLVGFSFGTQVFLHRGIAASRPASGGDWATKSGAWGCCGYFSALARDAKNGRVWTSWYSNDSPAKHQGVFVEKVFPKPVGNVLKAPSSTVRFAGTQSSLDPGQDMAMAASTRGGVYVAYKVGYPTANHIRIWEVGTRHSLKISAKDARHITLQTGPNGTLWIAWHAGTQNRVKVARTNSAVTRLGAVRTIVPPGRNNATIWKVSGSGASGPFHLVINAQAGVSKNPQIWYQKVAPGLTLVAKPRKLNKGVVTATVTDAGRAIANAKVTFRGASKHTNQRGIVKFRVAGGVPDGRYGMKATKPGYFPGHASVKVT